MAGRLFHRLCSVSKAREFGPFGEESSNPLSRSRLLSAFRGGEFSRNAAGWRFLRAKPLLADGAEPGDNREGRTRSLALLTLGPSLQPGDFDATR